MQSRRSGRGGLRNRNDAHLAGFGSHRAPPLCLSTSSRRHVVTSSRLFRHRAPPLCLSTSPPTTPRYGRIPWRSPEYPFSPVMAGGRLWRSLYPPEPFGIQQSWARSSRSSRPLWAQPGYGRRPVPLAGSPGISSGDPFSPVMAGYPGEARSTLSGRYPSGSRNAGHVRHGPFMSGHRICD